MGDERDRAAAAVTSRGSTAAAAIDALFAAEGMQGYLGEPVTQRHHMLLAATLAERAGAGDELVAAALLHDVGHFTLAAVARPGVPARDDRHERVGARWLARWFGPDVAGLVRLHVDAKRYLCATSPAYASALSPASVHSLDLQGGPMGARGAGEFLALPQAADAVALRRFDDDAKDPAQPTRELAHFLPLLERLARPA